MIKKSKYVLLSPDDADLLKKAHEMLVMAGIPDHVEWNKERQPDNNAPERFDRKVWYYALSIDYNDMGDCGRLLFHTHDCSPQIPIILTESNLTDSVNKVIAEWEKF